MKFQIRGIRIKGEWIVTSEHSNPDYIFTHSQMPHLEFHPLEDAEPEEFFIDTEIETDNPKTLIGLTIKTKYGEARVTDIVFDVVHSNWVLKTNLQDKITKNTETDAWEKYAILSFKQYDDCNYNKTALKRRIREIRDIAERARQTSKIKEILVLAEGALK